MKSNHHASRILGRRAKDRLKAPGGEWLRLILIQVLDRDEQGRARGARFVYDDDTVELRELATPEQLAGAEKPHLEFLLLWMSEDQIRMAKGERK